MDALNRVPKASVEMAARAGIEIGAVLDIVLGIDVGAGVDQRTGGLDHVGMGRNEKGGRSAAVARIDGGTLGKQGFDLRDIIGGCRLVQLNIHGITGGKKGRMKGSEEKPGRQQGEFQHALSRWFVRLKLAGGGAIRKLNV